MSSNQCLRYCCFKSLSLICVSFSLQTRILISKPNEDKPMGSQVNVQMKNVWKVLPAYYNLLCTVVSSHVAPLFVYMLICHMKGALKSCFMTKGITRMNSLTASYLPFSSPGARCARYASHAPNAHATHASWYRHAPGYEHDAWRAPSTRHPHGHGASRFAPTRPVTGWSAEDGSAESSHGVTAGGESQAAGEGSGISLLCYLIDAFSFACKTQIFIKSLTLSIR